ncbi:MAG: anthranilate phosphoribosyltransferase [Acidobacteria bacterium]|nr:anthranilate phosphoribosyltransferase [Acidobacteriota bacterium]
MKETIARLIGGDDLAADEVRELFGAMMDGELSEIQKTAVLVALRMKGETAEEIRGAAEAMRSRMSSIEVDTTHLVDTCGTGGDARGTVNISTIAAIVAAGAGARVAKHGNRAVSSSCGSADILRELGVNVLIDADQMKEVLRRVGIAFLFAPALHPAMAQMMPVRTELGVRTVFNVLGPLTNPARVKRQVLGVFASELVEPLAEVLLQLGAEHAMVVRGLDGMDEISTTAPTLVAEVRDGRVTTSQLDPESLGFERASLEDLRGGDAATNAGIAREVLNGDEGAVRDIVELNAGAALYVSGLARTIEDGIELAGESLDSGAARNTLDQLVRVSHEVAE